MYMYTCIHDMIMYYKIVCIYVINPLIHMLRHVFNQLRPVMCAAGTAPSGVSHRHADSCLRLLFAGLPPSGGCWDG